MLDQTYQDAAHLLRRAGFGGATEEIRRAATRGLAQTTDDLLHPERTPDPINDAVIIERLSALIPDDRKTAKNGREYLPTQVVKMWWTHRMIASPHPLVEKMTLFWHGHFTSKLPNREGDDMLRQNQLFRRHALGNFRTLTLAVSRDPAMLRYLNGNQNFKAQPNENYGRELMELFTCGRGNYTEDDVKAAARAFSGWNLRGPRFVFNAFQHDNGPKTFMGRTGNWNGDDIVDMLVAHPATAKRLCSQLFSYFAYTDPEPAVVNSLVQTYYGSGYDMRAVVGAILRSRAFYAPKARYALIKTPAQYVIGAVRMLGLGQQLAVPPAQITRANDMAADPGAAQPDATAGQRRQGQKLGSLAFLPTAMRQMGQDLLAPPSVKGWDGNEAWINSTTLLARISFANVISQARQSFDGRFIRATAFVRQNNMDAGRYVDFLAETLGPLPLTPQTRQALINYVNGADGADGAPAMSQASETDELRENGAVHLAQFAPVPPMPRPFARGRRRLNGQGTMNGQGAGVFGGPGFGGRVRLGQKAAARRGGGVGGRFGPEAGGLEGRLRGVIPLIMATPEFQVC